MKAVGSEDEEGKGKPRRRSGGNGDAPLWFSVPELAAHYGFSVATVRHWLKTKQLNASNGAHRIGGNWRINRIEFETKFMDTRGANN